MPNLVERYLFTISPDNVFFFFFKNFAFVFFYDFFFSFSLTWDHMGEKLQTTFPLKVHNRFTPKKNSLYTSREGLYQICIQIGEISNFGFLQKKKFVFVNMGPYGRKYFKRHLWKYITDSLPNIHAYSEEGSLPKCIKNCEISNFGFLATFFFFFLFFFAKFNMVVNGDL